MKIRSGFVSNSSSASFVVDWRCKLNGGNKLGFALHKLFDFWDLKYDEETDQIAIDDRYGQEYTLVKIGSDENPATSQQIEELKEKLKSPCANCETKCENQIPPEDEDVEGEDFLNVLRKIHRDSPPPEPVYPKGSTKEKMQFVSHIRNETTDNGDGRYRTAFFTSMMNDFEDFGDDPQRLIFALMVQAGICGNRDFEIVRAELVEDN